MKFFYVGIVLKLGYRDRLNDVHAFFVAAETPEEAKVIALADHIWDYDRVLDIQVQEWSVPRSWPVYRKTGEKKFDRQDQNIPAKELVEAQHEKEQRMYESLAEDKGEEG